MEARLYKFRASLRQLPKIAASLWPLALRRAALFALVRPFRRPACPRCDDGYWESPGGVVEQHEDLHSVRVREVREEAGYTIRPGSLTGVYKKHEAGHRRTSVPMCTCFGRRNARPRD